MTPEKFSRALVLTTAAFAVFLTGCLHEESALGGPESLKVSNTSEDPRIRFLTNELGVEEERISKLYDPIDKDTGYVIEPVMPKKARAKKVKAMGVGFKAKRLNEIMLDFYNKKHAEQGIVKFDSSLLLESSTSSITNTINPNGLGKKGQTRWDYWGALWDVKALREVYQVKVYIYTSGPARLGPNWTAAVRSAISNWNAQAKGTAMSFVETSSATDHDISFRGSFGIGDEGTLTSSAFLTPDHLVEPDGISLWVNTGYENSATPHNQKTTIAMSLLALSTNITFTGMEGYYWNNGASVHIPGTPSTDGDAWTPGSSILTYGTSSYSTPVMSAGDLRAFQTIYPSHGQTFINYWNELSVTGYESWQAASQNVKTFQIAGDTLIFLRGDGRLFRKIKLSGSNVQIWPASGSSGNAADFLFSKGFLAVRNTSGKIYTRTPTGNWVAQNSSTTYGPSSYRLDGNRLVTRAETGNGSELRSFWLGGSSPSPISLDWYASTTLTDWQVKDGLLVVVDGGNVWAMQNYQGWNLVQSNTDGYANSIRLSEDLWAMTYTPNGYGYQAFAVRFGGIGGWWGYYYDPVYTIEDIEVCGNKLAFLQQSQYLRTIDYSTWSVYEHYAWGTGLYDIRKIRLMGANCDYIGILDHNGTYLSKYGIDMENYYEGAMGGNIRLGQKDVPVYIP